MFHSEYESRLRSPSKSPSKIKYNNTPILSSPLKFSFFNEDNSSNNNSSSSNNNNSINIMNNENQNDSNIMNTSPNKTTTTTTTTTSTLGNYYHPSNHHDSYGDRFIPISSFDSMYQYNTKDIQPQQQHFNNTTISPSTTSTTNNNILPNGTTTTIDRQRDESHLAYNLVLKNEILRSPNASPIKSSNNKYQQQQQQQDHESTTPKKNKLDWSSTNLLAVGLDTTVYLWNATTSQVSKLCDMDSNQPITSVSWIQRGTHLAVGGNDGIVQIWDVTKKQKIRELGGHNQRVNAMAWNNHILSSGGKDKVILNHDVRSSENYSSKLIGHKHEVCGLKWSPDGTQLASGGNDNLLNVWDQSSTRPLYQFKFHNAAVKAIAWSPHQRGLLASGGGTHDKCIRFWNTNTGHSIQSIDTGSQVCNLAWSKNVNEFVSTHGYSQNQITIWNYATMTPITTLTGHTMRVLYLSISPDGQTIVTGAGDNTLRFWNVFPSNKETTFSYNMDSFFNKHDLDIR
ncbi:hypothetical protein CYY_008065 [Polysphondylium violaceum]|uniref:CDC20/Fizzy WD40 domain-containing protein n=1 Tax=Polysphondylium violaceum TaxID=133409 RepID=A0A8J4PNG7_9MYCE|nr:hypothetical protein CYY_008065 [Polysphondylium violaceum]